MRTRSSSFSGLRVSIHELNVVSETEGATADMIEVHSSRAGGVSTEAIGEKKMYDKMSERREGNSAC